MKRIVRCNESVSLDEEFTMTDDSRTPLGQEHLSDAFLWLVGTPLTILDSLYLTRLAPPLEPEHPDTLVVWILGVLALFLLIWGLLSSACAHLALLRGAPPPSAASHTRSSLAAEPGWRAQCSPGRAPAHSSGPRW